MLDLEKYSASEQVIQTVIEHIWEEYDEDKSGSLDFEETKFFLQDGLGFLGLEDYKLDEEMFRNIFNQYDEDQSGTIDKDEMAILIKSMMGGIKGSTDEYKLYT